jgi:glycosyltransferase involved in cell wall biosynthesis
MMEDRSETPVVSIILPTFNRAETIGRSIRSALNQTYSNFELLVIDDGSTDNTAGVLAAVSDPRLRVIWHTTNRGAPAARNTGIANARGTYISFLDSDDEWHPDKIEKELAIMEDQPEVGVVYSGFWRHIHGKKSYVPFKWVKSKEGNIHRELLWRNFINTQSLIRKNVLDTVGVFDENAPRFQDWDLFIRISEHYPFAYSHEALFDVYHSEQSITADPRAQITGLLYILKKHCSEFSLHPPILAEQYFQLSLLYFFAGDRKKAHRSLMHALKLNRFSAKYLAVLCLSVSPWLMQFVFFTYKSLKNEW